jgi:hypothetical protein
MERTRHPLVYSRGGAFAAVVAYRDGAGDADRNG